MTSQINKTPFENVQWNIVNKSTKKARNIGFALLMIAAISMGFTFGGHGLAPYFSDPMVFGGFLAVVSGGVYVGLKIRDWREKVKLKDIWDTLDKSTLVTEARRLGTDDVYVKELLLGGSKGTIVWVETNKECTRVKIHKNKPL